MKKKMAKYTQKIDRSDEDVHAWKWKISPKFRATIFKPQYKVQEKKIEIKNANFKFENIR